ncbi:outer membrane protein beta-barrel domain protein [Antarctobacter heliothermus]|uniref:Outer membrane protein beta-barrel domain protein n=1 Tax=Antarctobacter heliothermus TaxID=74033 RepID=A0A222E7J6_9RHOB|nr:outer membrane beta-barrel protein [Antarctobacter heliothermus]ASP22177.1 outer membrane protein beta-barrel domain protein [Antarctobacter heliothermus]
MKSSIFALVAATATLGAAPVLAGSLDDTPVEVVPAAPIVPVAPIGVDWTGLYGGLSLGNMNAQGAGTSNNGTIFGLHTGYDYDFGKVVVGGEFEYQAGDDYDLGGVDVDNVMRLKGRVGYEMGQSLLYGTAGVARIDTALGDATGPVGGVGLEYRVNDRVSIGGEALAHSFDDVGGSGVDVDAQTFSLRASFRF